VTAAPTQAAGINTAANAAVQVRPQTPGGVPLVDLTQQINAAIAAVLVEIGTTATQTAADGGDIEGVSK